MRDVLCGGGVVTYGPATLYFIYSDLKLATMSYHVNVNETLLLRILGRMTKMKTKMKTTTAMTAATTNKATITPAAMPPAELLLSCCTADSVRMGVGVGREWERL